MKIKEFEIRNLYGKYTIKSQLDEKVNIIVGNNGTYKTTLLRILNSISSFVLPMDFFNLDSVEIKENNNLSVKYNEYDSTVSELGEKAKDNNLLKQMYEKVLSDTHTISQKNNLTVNYHILTAFQDGKEIEDEDYSKQAKVNIISTFDIKGDGNDKEKSFLDSNLEKLQSEYGYYLSELMKELTDHISTSSSITKVELDKINERKNDFIRLVNEAFAETGKKLNPDSAKLKFEKDGKIIEAKDLSSGEKQLLIILLTVLLERGQEYVLMLDEPEISMHISWQYKLIDMILELNPNVQIILTTHSPMIFSDGWGDKAIHMEDITTNTRK
jgi:predicted ATP-dependent endonuclease of OLD family